MSTRASRTREHRRDMGVSTGTGVEKVDEGPEGRGGRPGHPSSSNPSLSLRNRVNPQHDSPTPGTNGWGCEGEVVWSNTLTSWCHLRKGTVRFHQPAPTPLLYKGPRGPKRGVLMGRSLSETTRSDRYSGPTLPAGWVVFGVVQGFLKDVRP